MPYDNYNWITDDIAIGGMVSEAEELPFDAILSLVPDAPPSVRDLALSERIEYRWHSIIDGYSFEENDEIVRRFNAAAEQLDRWLASGKRVLVHCVAGVSRSATAVVWYLVRFRGMTWEEATALVRAYRLNARPNIRFEIPLRISQGERFTREQVERMAEAYCQRIWLDEEVEVDPKDIIADLERQGTLARIPA